MKSKKSFIFLLFVFIANTAISQNFSTKFGLLSGNASTKIKTNNSTERMSLQPVLGLYLGIGHDIKLKNQFGLKTELLLTLKGYHIDCESCWFNFPNYFIYASVPILGEMKIDDLISFELGVEPAYSLFDITKVERNESNQFDLNLLAGCSFMVNKKLELSFRFSNGMIPFLTTPARDGQGKKKYFHKTFQAGFGYNFGSSKKSPDE